MFERSFRTLQSLGPAHFAGRQQELAWLRDQLAKPQAAVGVIGLGGMGKTSLLRVFAERYGGGFSGGVHFLSPHRPDEATARTIAVSLQPTLFVIDYADAVTPTQLLRDIRATRQRCSDSRFVLVARHSMRSVLPEFAPFPELVLGPLSMSDIGQVWQSNLVELSAEDIRALYDFSGGVPLAAELLGRLIRDRRLSVRDLPDLLADFEQAGIVDPAGTALQPQTEQYTEIVSGVAIVSEEALRWLERHPEALHALNPRQFEELVAELFQRDGWEVVLTPPSKDGGKDLYVARKASLGSFLYIVECKKYGPDNPVGVGVVRSLYGVVQAEKLAGGIVATTSYFTKGAKEFQQTVKYQLALAEYVDLVEWIKKTFRRLRGGPA